MFLYDTNNLITIFVDKCALPLSLLNVFLMLYKQDMAKLQGKFCILLGCYSHKISSTLTNNLVK